jgi:hypothetical protein
MPLGGSSSLSCHTVLLGSAAASAKVYIDSMRTAPIRCTAASLLVGVLLCGAAVPAAAQVLAPDYALTAPAWQSEPELLPRLPVATWGPMRLSIAGSDSGSGLSVEAGESWFARAGIGRSLDNEVVSLGAGYRFGGGDALSLQVTRQLAQDRLGLALRYDWRWSYLRLSYDQPLRTPGPPDRLRFSAGMRF